MAVRLWQGWVSTTGREGTGEPVAPLQAVLQGSINPPAGQAILSVHFCPKSAGETCPVPSPPSSHLLSVCSPLLSLPTSSLSAHLLSLCQPPLSLPTSSLSTHLLSVWWSASPWMCVHSRTLIRKHYNKLVHTYVQAFGKTHLFLARTLPLSMDVPMDTRTHTHMQPPPPTQVCTQALSLTYPYTRRRARRHTETHTRANAHAHVLLDTHANATQAHAHTHAHIHMRVP